MFILQLSKTRLKGTACEAVPFILFLLGVKKVSEILKKYEILSGMTKEQKDFFYKELSYQRHDFMNALQIVTGYLQVDMLENALNASLQYGKKNESFGRLHKYGLFLLGKLIDEYQRLFLINGNKLDIINELPPTNSKIDLENEYAIDLINKLLNDINKISEENIILEVILIDKDKPGIKILVAERLINVLIKYIKNYAELVGEISIGGISGEENLGFIQFALTKS